ncbi:MAG: hypothetical protein ACFBZ8_12240 [Opitutales bacterium]
MPSPKRRVIRKQTSLLTVVLIAIGPALISMAIEAAAHVAP